LDFKEKSEKAGISPTVRLQFYLIVSARVCPESFCFRLLFSGKSHIIHLSSLPRNPLSVDVCRCRWSDRFEARRFHIHEALMYIKSERLGSKKMYIFQDDQLYFYFSVVAIYSQGGR